MLDDQQGNPNSTLSTSKDIYATSSRCGPLQFASLLLSTRRRAGARSKNEISVAGCRRAALQKDVPVLFRWFKRTREGLAFKIDSPD